MLKTISAAIALTLFAGSALAQQTVIDVKKTATCGCCSAWVDRMKQSGFQVKPENVAMGQLMRFKLSNGIKSKHAACHTARVGGYTIEGHVPVREINRLLKERPDAVGLAVPGMPTGSPGMDFGTTRDAYDVLLIKKDGSAVVYASYPAIKK